MKHSHLVVKHADIYDYLLRSERHELNIYLQTIQDQRIRAGKPASPDYLVINMDEPYADEVIDIMRAHGHWDDDPLPRP